MATPRDRTPLPPDHTVPLLVATLFAPLVVLAPAFFVVVAQGEGGRVEAVLGMYAVSTGVAGTLLVAAGRRGRARSLHVGLVWVLAGAAAAAIFAPPSTSHIGGGYPQDVVLGAFLGAFTSSVFAGLRRLFSPSAG